MVTRVRGATASDATEVDMQNGETVEDAVNQRTIYVGSVAELEALSLPVGTNVYLTADGRAGEFVVKSGTPPSDPQKGIYIVLANGNYAERNFVGDVYTRWFGADGNDPAKDYEGIQAAFSMFNQDAVINGENIRYSVASSLTIKNPSYLELKDFFIEQTAEANNMLTFTGTFAVRVVFKNVNLSHTFNSSLSGNGLHVSETITNFNFLEWTGGNITGGFYSIRTYGKMFMCHFEKVWALRPYSSAWYMPASGDTSSINLQLGGSTTTKLYKCFVVDVQTDAPAYNIASGWDTVVLEQCSADRCYRFGSFRANPLRIINCSGEQVINPPVGTSGTPHRYIQIGSGTLLTFDGFHITLDASFVAPTAPGGTVNSFLYTINTRLNLFGVRGEIPASYHTLDQDGGVTLYNIDLLGNGIRKINGGIARSVQQIPETARPNRTNLSGTTGGNSAPTTLWSFEPGRNVYILYTTYSFGTDAESTTWVVFTDSSTGLGKATKLASGPSFPSSISISISGTNVEYSTSQNISSGWQAFNLTLKDI